MVRAGLHTTLLVLVLLPCAEAASPRQTAEALLREGNLLHQRGEYALALDRYHEARRLYPSYKIDFNIGVTLDALGREVEAAEHFERFILGGKLASPQMVAAARARLARLRERIASFALECAPLAGAQVSLDGAVVGRTPLDRRVYLRPGTYTLAVVSEGYRPDRRRLELRAGDHVSLRIALERIPQASTPAPFVAAPAPRRRPARRRPAEPPPIYRRWWFWTVIGVAVVGGATVGVVLGTRERTDARLPHGELGSWSFGQVMRW